MNEKEAKEQAEKLREQVGDILGPVKKAMEDARKLMDQLSPQSTRKGFINGLPATISLTKGNELTIALDDRSQTESLYNQMTQ